MGVYGSDSLVAAMSSRSSTQWKGFRSKEIWERAQRSSVITYAPCSAAVSCPGHFRSVSRTRSQKASVSVSNVGEHFASSFWAADGRLKLCPFQTWIPSFSRSLLLVEARLIGPAIFQASKLRVLLLGKHSQKVSELVDHPRIYTLTHSDLTAKLTLAIAQEINQAQITGWYSRLQRDEVLAEWRRTKGVMSLHVHCHISGSNWLHYWIAKLRFFIFQKELPLVLEAIMHGDTELFKKHPQLQNAPVWVYFHSDVEDYNRVEYWGTLLEATKRSPHMPVGKVQETVDEIMKKQFLSKGICRVPCECCSKHETVVPIPESLKRLLHMDVDSKHEQNS